jgi:hypothetical protein
VVAPGGASPAPTKLYKALWLCCAKRRWVEVDFDLGLGVDGLVVQVCWLIVPFADGCGYLWEKGHGAVESLNVGDVAALVDADQNCNRTVGGGLLRELRIDSRVQFAQDYFLLSPPQPPFARNAIAWDSHRPFHVHGERTGAKYALARDVYVRSRQAPL